MGSAAHLLPSGLSQPLADALKSLVDLLGADARSVKLSEMFSFRLNLFHAHLVLDFSRALVLLSVGGLGVVREAKFSLRCGREAKRSKVESRARLRSCVYKSGRGAPVTPQAGNARPVAKVQQALPPAKLIEFSAFIARVLPYRRELSPSTEN